MGHILRMNPVFKEMIWGGTKLKDIYGYEIPSDHTGECWAISAHKNGDCTIADGEYKGKTLSWLFENHRELFGNIEGDQFPLLVKIIDAKNDLSVQVHPDDAYAKEHENLQERQNVGLFFKRMKEQRWSWDTMQRQKMNL